MIKLQEICEHGMSGFHGLGCHECLGNAQASHCDCQKLHQRLCMSRWCSVWSYPLMNHKSRWAPNGAGQQHAFEEGSKFIPSTLSTDTELCYCVPILSSGIGQLLCLVGVCTTRMIIMMTLILVWQVFRALKGRKSMMRLGMPRKVHT